MKVIISDYSREKVYHRTGCWHLVRISDRHRMDLGQKEAVKMGYRACRCCGNLKGSLRAMTSSLEKTGKARQMELTYDSKTDILYMRTKCGFWKAYWKEDLGLLLYHLDNYKPEMSTEELAATSFHRQRDVRPTESIGRILEYVDKHDKAKMIISDDYRKLPQRTKREKKYYRKAERFDKYRQISRVYELLEKIENEWQANQSVRKAAVG